MKSVFLIIVCISLIGCHPSPASKETHIKQVQRAIAKAGGETNILAESRTLFTRLSRETNSILSGMADHRYFERLSAITNLGDVFEFDSSEPDLIRIRVYKSHWDIYFIALVNPDHPQPAGFERIAGNVGFLEPGNAANLSQPVRSETNRPSAAEPPAIPHP